MFFNDLEFVYFFLPVLVVYYCLNRWEKVNTKNAFLLFASYTFYGLFDVRMLAILLWVTLVNYESILLIAKAKSCIVEVVPKKCKVFLTIGIILSILPLIFFKYTYFIINEVIGIPGQIFGDIILPVGISFFTFQAISYTLDFYRSLERQKPLFLNYCLFVAFFPCILSGPIERARSLMPQIKSIQKLNLDYLFNGMQIFAWGIFQKVVVADRLSDYLYYVYRHTDIYGANTYLLAMAFYSIRIYCDFAGYSNMAIGVGRMLGFDIRKNFDFPYFSTTIKSFWKKWHMSLTSWFTEYVYISLGGNRVRESRWIANILIVFLVSGLWHGAAWTFIIWGLIHGFYQILEHYTLGKYEFTSWWAKALAGLFLFIMVTIAWVFFCADNLSHALRIFGALGNGIRPLFTLFSIDWILLWFVLLVFVIVEVLQYKRVVKMSELSDSPYNSSNIIIFIILFLMTSLLGRSGASFVYFQF